MAWREVRLDGGHSGTEFVSYAKANKGDNWEGYYQGPRQGTYGVNFVVKGEETEYHLPSNGLLQKLLEEKTAVGDYIRVTFTGKKVMKGGKYPGKEVNTFRVDIDDERKKQLPF